MGSNDRNSRQQGQRGWQGRSGYYQQDNERPVEPMAVPENYVDAAEKIMTELKAEKRRDADITTTKLRGFLSMVNDIYNNENLRGDETLLDASMLKIMRLRVRIVYDAGRDQDVKTFVKKARLLEHIKWIGSSRTNMLRFAHYMEALVAYRYYLVGREN